VQVRRHGVLSGERPVDVFEDEVSPACLARERDDARALPGVGIFEPDLLLRC